MKIEFKVATSKNLRGPNGLEEILNKGWVIYRVDTVKVLEEETGSNVVTEKLIYLLSKEVDVPGLLSEIDAPVPLMNKKININLK